MSSTPDDSDDSDPKVLQLQRGQSATALGLKVTFTGAGPMSYGDGQPPVGGMTIDFDSAGQHQTAMVPQRRWGEALTVLGYSYRVLNSPDPNPMTLQIEIRKA
jgi:hypothetical protein